MREIANQEKILKFMRELSRETHQEARLYFVGGATAVLIGWRPTTIDVDIKIIPDSDELLRAIQSLKDQLSINVELAAPDNFIPPLPNWQQRSIFVNKEGSLTFYHYDLYAQALAKIERGHQQDLQDVKAMLERKLVDPKKLLKHYQTIEPQLYRYPAIDPPTFRRAVEKIIEK